MQQDFSQRTTALFGEAAFSRLGSPLVAISGLGGVGGAAFMTPVRSGVRRFRLAENGIFDPPDMNRQWGALEATMDRPKIDVYAEWAKGINTKVELNLFPEGITVANVEEFLTGCDLYLGAIDVDKGQEVKDKSEEIIAREGIPLFTCGAFGMGAFMVNFAPGGMTPADFWSKAAEKSGKPALIPEVLKQYYNTTLMANLEDSVSSGSLGTCATGAGMAGLLVATEMLTAMLEQSDFINRAPVFAPRFTTVDLTLMRFEVVDIMDPAV